MKTFYYKNKNIIKILITITTLLLLIFIPIILVLSLKTINFDKKINEPEIQLKNGINPINQKFENNEYFSDFNFLFNFDNFNDWKVDDYLIYIDSPKQTENQWAIDGNGNELIWINDHSDWTDDQIKEKSIAFSFLSNPSSTNDENIELINKIRNSNEWNNNIDSNKPKVEKISEFDGIYTLSAFARFSYINDNNSFNYCEKSLLSLNFQTLQPNNISLSNFEIPDYNPSKNELKNFFSFEQNSNIIFGSDIYMYINPEINTLNINPLNVYEEIPQIKISLYIDDEIKPISSQIIKLENNKFKLNKIYLPIDKLYNSNGEIDKNIDENNIFINCDINWKFKTNIELNELYGDKISWKNDVDLSGQSFKYSLQKIKLLDSIRFLDYFKFNWTIPKLTIFPSWDENNLFSIQIATKNKFLFENDIDLEWRIAEKMNFIDKNGNEFLTWVSLNRIQKINWNGNEFYYSKLQPANNLNKNSIYQISNTSLFEFKSKNKYGEPFLEEDNHFLLQINKNNEDLNISENFELNNYSQLNLDDDKNDLLIPENISLLNFDHVVNKKIIILIISLLILLILVIPVSFSIFLKFFKNKKYKN